MDMQEAVLDESDTRNATESYKSKIAPIVAELRNACYKAKIPMFATFAVSDDGIKTEYVREILSPAMLGVRITQNQIRSFIRIMQGYKLVAPEDDDEIPIGGNLEIPIQDMILNEPGSIDPSVVDIDVIYGETEID